MIRQTVASLTATAALAAFAGPASAATPSHRPPSPTQTALLQADLQALVSDGRGVGTTIDIDSRPLTWASAAGDEEVGRKRAPKATDAYRIGSVSKAMVATLVMQQVQAGRWELDNKVSAVAPGLLPADRADVTLEQLLSHRSGLPDYLVALLPQQGDFGELVTWHERDYTPAQLLAASNNQPVTTAPGAKYAYSNTNYVVLGLLLERATHRPLAQQLQQRVFRPAGMHHTELDDDPGMRGRHLTESAYYDKAYSLQTADPSVFWAAGAVVSTSDDVNRFYDALLRGRLLEPSLVNEMLRPRTTEAEGVAYGLGIYSLPDPCDETQRVYGHDGATFGTQTMTFHDRRSTRDITFAWTGRAYDGTVAPAMPLLRDALLATCSTTPRASKDSHQARTYSANKAAPVGSARAAFERMGVGHP